MGFLWTGSLLLVLRRTDVRLTAPLAPHPCIVDPDELHVVGTQCGGLVAHDVLRILEIAAIERALQERVRHEPEVLAVWRWRVSAERDVGSRCRQGRLLEVL